MSRIFEQPTTPFALKNACILVSALTTAGNAVFTCETIIAAAEAKSDCGLIETSAA